MSWSLYPSEPRQRRATIVRDVLTLAALTFLAWLGRRVYQLVDNLSVVTDSVERRQLLAMRAAISLPADHLLKYSPDPMGDLVRGDYDALVKALLADAGLAPAVAHAGE